MKRLKTWFAALATAVLFPSIFLATFLVAFAAFAQDVVTPETPPAELTQLLFRLVTEGGFWPAAGVAVMLLVFVLRVMGAKLSPRLAALLDDPLVKLSLPFVVAAAAGFANAFLVGGSLKSALFAALKVAMAAILAYVGSKQIAEARAAGKAAAEGIADDKSAAAVLRGPGQ